jgi:hypothetical protein
MNPVMDVFTLHVHTPAYAGIERRRMIRQTSIQGRKPAPVSAPPWNHPRRVAVEFVCLLAAGILWARLCAILDRPAHAAPTLPTVNFTMAIYRWSGFHRIAVR